MMPLALSDTWPGNYAQGAMRVKSLADRLADKLVDRLVSKSAEYDYSLRQPKLDLVSLKITIGILMQVRRS